MQSSFIRPNWIQALLALGLIAFVTACGGAGTVEGGDVEDSEQPQQTETLEEGEGEEEEGEGEEGDND